MLFLWLWSLPCDACSKGFHVHISDIIISAFKRVCNILLPPKWMQVSLKDYQSRFLLSRHIYAFTLLMKCYYTCSKEISGNIQTLLCFPQWSKKFYPHFKGKSFITIRGWRRIGHWKVSLLKVGQHLSLLLFLLKREENGVDWLFIYMTDTDGLRIY